MYACVFVCVFMRACVSACVCLCVYGEGVLGERGVRAYVFVGVFLGCLSDWRGGEMS